MSNVADIREKVTTIKLGGKEKTLKFTLNAFAELEEAYGSVDKALEAVDSGSMKAIRKLLWAGLLHDDPNITEMEVGNMIDVRELIALGESLGNAIDQALPQGDVKAATENVGE